VTLDQIIYHTEMVKRGAPNTFVVADMPFLSYQISVEEALRNCGLVMKETNCDAVKLEGGEEVAHLVRQAYRNWHTSHGTHRRYTSKRQTYGLWQAW